MTDIVIRGGRTLVDQELADASVATNGKMISAVQSNPARASVQIDAGGLLVLPGIIDLHGDAFERQMMPRPGVGFPIDVALADSDRQAIANGITTVFHATTWSWEPGLRGAENARKLIDAIEAQRPHLAADTRFHLRQETYNLDAEDTIIEWLKADRIDLLAFNDHMSSIAADMARPQKRAQMAERAGLNATEFDELVKRVAARKDDVPGSIARLAAAGVASGTPMLSHDDNTSEMRRSYRAMGVRIAEFPINVPTAQEAAQAGEFIVFGAPNVVRGGSHTGWTRAADMITQGLCSVLASDYYYPAQLLAAFRLAADNVLPLGRAWSLISEMPARAAGLADRGRIAEGARADIILVDPAETLRPRVVAVIAAGRIVHLTDIDRVQRTGAVSQSIAAA